MSVVRVMTPRDRVPDLLIRPPAVGWAQTTPWPHPLVDPVEQLEALADLLMRGFLSRDEFELQKQKVNSE